MKFATLVWGFRFRNDKIFFSETVGNLDPSSLAHSIEETGGI